MPDDITYVLKIRHDLTKYHKYHQLHNITMTKIKEIVTSRNGKAVLFASLIAAMVLPFSTLDLADAKGGNDL